MNMPTRSTSSFPSFLVESMSHSIAVQLNLRTIICQQAHTSQKNFMSYSYKCRRGNSYYGRFWKCWFQQLVYIYKICQYTAILFSLTSTLFSSVNHIFILFPFVETLAYKYRIKLLTSTNKLCVFPHTIINHSNLRYTHYFTILCPTLPPNRTSNYPVGNQKFKTKTKFEFHNLLSTTLINWVKKTTTITYTCILL